MLLSGKNRIFWQILVWGGTWLLISFILTSGYDQPDRFIRRGLGSLIGIVIIVVVNLKILLPHLYFRKRTVMYVIAGIALFLFVVFFINGVFFPWSEWFNPQDRPFSALRESRINPNRKANPFGFQLMRHMIPFFIAFMGSTLVEIARFASQKEKDLIRSQKDMLVTEIKFLKSQINPHFLFNTLNNIYTLTVIKSEKASDSLLNLSNLLRYMLYDSNVDLVPLKKELEYLKNYINLILLKDSKGMDITVDLDESRPDLLISPLIFIPFVENAFKHSKIEDRKSGCVVIQLKTTDKTLEFKVINSIPEVAFSKDGVGGIGLVNIQKRLELLYPDRHQLEINDSENQFEVFLKLKIE